MARCVCASCPRAVQTTHAAHSSPGPQRLIELHTEHPAAMLESGLTRDERNLLTGALEYAHKKVADVMTTIDNVYMVEASTKLDFDTMLDIYKCGYTRIPVYEGHRQNIVGILYVKARPEGCDARRARPCWVGCHLAPPSRLLRTSSWWTRTMRWRCAPSSRSTGAPTCGS